MAWEAKRLGAVFSPVITLCDMAVHYEVTLKEVLTLVKSGYAGSVKRKEVLEQCAKKGHDGKPGDRCKRCSDRIPNMDTGFLDNLTTAMVESENERHIFNKRK